MCDPESEHMTDYQRFISWLEEVPLYGHKDGTNNIRKLMKRFGDPQESFRVIHVAGTNGKGSCCAMLASILTKSGYRTGLFTSPHLVDYTERIQVDGQMIPREDFVRLGELVRGEIRKMVEEGENHCTFFEILTAMGLLYFHEAGAEVVILETGVGGRLDATNIIEPPSLILTLITSISLDHTKVLGDTRELIAFEKAGIMRPAVPVILSKNLPGVQQVVRERAEELGCPYVYAGDMPETDERRYTATKERYTIPLEGDYQAENLTTVLMAVDLLRKSGQADRITDETLKEGLLSTNWPGRMQRALFEGKPLLLDGAHNPDGARRLADYLGRNCPSDSVTLVFSALGKKDVSGILTVLRDCPAVRRAVFTRIHGEENEERFIKDWSGADREDIKPYVTVPDPLGALREAAREEDTSLVVCAGSLYLIGEVLERTGGSHV